VKNVLFLTNEVNVLVRPEELGPLPDGSVFTVWDTLDLPSSDDFSLSLLTSARLGKHLLRDYSITLHTITIGDELIYADFMPVSSHHQ